MKKPAPPACEAPCSPPCTRPAIARDLCLAHYQRFLRGAELRTPVAAHDGERRRVSTTITGSAFEKLQARAKAAGLSIFAMASHVLETSLGLEPARRGRS